eukprot:10059564-Ditylum_brightwellii.AAC.1
MAPSTKQSNPDMKGVVIAFQQPPPRQLGRRQYHMYKLCTTSADITLPIYELSVPFFDKGTPEEWIKFRYRLQAVLKGQNVMQGQPSYAVAKTLLKGNVLTMTWQTHISGESRADPEALNVEEHTFWQRNYHEGMGDLSLGT